MGQLRRVPVVLGAGDQVPLPRQPELVQGRAAAAELGDVLDLPQPGLLPRLGKLGHLRRVRWDVHHERDQDAIEVADVVEFMPRDAGADSKRDVHELPIRMLAAVG